MAISIAGLLALWRLWGTPYNIIWWAVLILMILGWITAQIKRTSAKGESEQEVTGFWSCANKGILVICLILAVVGIVLVYAVHLPHKGEIADQSQVDPRSRAVESDDRRFCRTAMISFIKAQGMQWDADGNKKLLLPAQEEELKTLIRTGIESAERVSDSFLDAIHPFLKEEFRDRLVQGWTIYLEGLETHNEQTQARGIRLLMEWEDFKVDFIDLFYETIIKTPEPPL